MVLAQISHLMRRVSTQLPILQEKTRRVFLVVRIFLNGPVSSQVKEMEWQKSEISLFFRQVSFAGHRSQLIVLPIPKVSKTLVKANLIRPKQKFFRPKVSFYKCLGYFLC